MESISQHWYLTSQIWINKKENYTGGSLGVRSQNVCVKQYSIVRHSLEKSKEV